MMRAIAGDRRGLATGLIGFILIIVVTGLLYAFLDPIITDAASFGSAQASSSLATSTGNTRLAIWNRLPFFGLALALLFIISRSVYEGRQS